MIESDKVSEEIFKSAIRKMTNALVTDMTNDLIDRALEKVDYEFANDKKKQSDDDLIEPKAKRAKFLDWANVVEVHTEYKKKQKQTSFIQPMSCLKILLADKNQLMELIRNDELKNDNTKNESNIANDSISYSITSALSESGDEFHTDTTDTQFEFSQNKSPSHEAKELNRNSNRGRPPNPFKNLKANYDVSLCLECANSDESEDSICRFVGWRRLILNENENILTESGFLELNDAKQEDYEIWELNENIETTTDENNLEANELKIICYIGKIFMEMVNYEFKLRESIEESNSINNKEI